MGSLRKFKRVRIGKANRDEKNIAQDLAKEAFVLHEEGVQFAVDLLNAANNDVGSSAKDLPEISIEPYHVAVGHGTKVSFKDTIDDVPHHFQEILVASKPDKLAVTDDAIATTASWTTKAITMIPDDYGEPIMFVIWQGSTDPHAVGIQTAVSTHF